MKHPRLVLSALLLSALAVAACAVSRDDVAVEASDLLEQYDALVADEAKAQESVASAEQQFEAAKNTPDQSDDLPAAEALAKANDGLSILEQRIARLEGEVVKRRASPLANLLPYGLGSALLSSILPLLGSRGRKLYASAFRNLSSGRLLIAAGDILKAVGAQHSSPQPPPAA